MKTFLVIFLAGYAVRCDDSNYYVVQRPEDPSPSYKVYWNVPTMQCTSKKIPFADLYDKFGILQNDQDSFRGEKISILYDPGLFPALLKNESSGRFKYRNGGVPQEGDLMKHLNIFKSEMEQSIPDKDFNGVGIIDFESWRPVFRQNFGVLTPYKDVSYEIEKKNHWWWKKSWTEAEAKRRFEESARAFMQTTLVTAKKMRPRAKWGYYGFPYCFNMGSNNMREKCAERVPQENDDTYWLWSESSAVYPSVYSTAGLTGSQLAALIRGRVAEARRVSAPGVPVLPYFWFRYRNGEFFTKDDLYIALATLFKSNASGFIIWGSSNDVNTVEKCNKLLTYVNNILGPAVAKYTKNKVFSDDYDLTETTNLVNNDTMYEPELIWKPPQNYTENIEEMVDEELKDKNKTEAQNGNMLIDLILHSIVNYCVDDNCHNKHKENGSNELVTTEGVNYYTSGSESQPSLVTEDPFKLNNTDAIDTTESITTYNYIESAKKGDIDNSSLGEDYSEKLNESTTTYGESEIITYYTSTEVIIDAITDISENIYETDLVNSNEHILNTNDSLDENDLTVNDTDSHQYYDENHRYYIVNINYDEIVNTNTDILNSDNRNTEESILNTGDTMLNSTTLEPILTKQVVDSASRSKPIICTFVHSIAKVICVILHMLF